MLCDFVLLFRSRGIHPTQEAGGRPLEDEYGYRTTLDDPQHRKLTLKIVSANVEDND